MTEDARDTGPEFPDDPEDADPGLARARTEMAWSRSSLAFAAVGIAILKRSPAVGIPILVFGVVAWSIGHLARTSGSAPAAGRALLVTVAITMLATAALVLAVLGPTSPGLRH